KATPVIGTRIPTAIKKDITCHRKARNSVRSARSKERSKDRPRFLINERPPEPQTVLKGAERNASTPMKECAFMKTQCKWNIIAAFPCLLALSASLFAASAASGAANSAPSGSGASVVGKVKFTGQVPQPSKLSMNADPSCAKLHPGPAMSQEFLTGSDN